MLLQRHLPRLSGRYGLRVMSLNFGVEVSRGRSCDRLDDFKTIALMAGSTYVSKGEEEGVRSGIRMDGLFLNCYSRSRV